MSNTFMLIALLIGFVIFLIISIHEVCTDKQLKELHITNRLNYVLFSTFFELAIFVCLPLGLFDFFFFGGLEEVIHNKHAIKCEYCGDDERLEKHFEHSKYCSVCRDEFLED